MKRKVRQELRRKRGELSRSQAFELQAQAFAMPPLHFADDDDRRAAWEEFRAELLAQTRPGARPSAWWVYEHRDAMPRSADPQALALYRMGEATQADIDDLAAELAYFETTPELCRWSAATWADVRATLAAWERA
jgi:hypothetical protein